MALDSAKLEQVIDGLALVTDLLARVTELLTRVVDDDERRIESR